MSKRTITTEREAANAEAIGDLIDEYRRISYPTMTLSDYLDSRGVKAGSAEVKDKIGNEIHVGDRVANAASEDYCEYHLDIDTVSGFYTDRVGGEWLVCDLGNGDTWHASPDSVVVVKEP